MKTKAEHFKLKVIVEETHIQACDAEVGFWGAPFSSFVFFTLHF